MKNKKLQIGIIGSAGLEEYPSGKGLSQASFDIAEKTGRLLAQEGAVTITGGKGGIMEYAARGAKQAGGQTIGVIKGKNRFTSNNFTDIEVLSGAQADGLDEYLLVMMCDALIVIGGGAGTLQEIVIAYRNNKTIILLDGTGGWCDKLIAPYLDERKKIKFLRAATPEIAVNLVMQKTRHHLKASS